MLLSKRWFTIIFFLIPFLGAVITTFAISESIGGIFMLLLLNNLFLFTETAHFLERDIRQNGFTAEDDPCGNSNIRREPWDYM